MNNPQIPIEERYIEDSEEPLVPPSSHLDPNIERVKNANDPDPARAALTLQLVQAVKADSERKREEEVKAVRARRVGWEAAISALIANRSVRAAARQCKVNEKTLYRLLGDAEFANAYQIAQEQVVASSVSRHNELHTRALQRLEKALDSGTEHVAVRAAIVLLERTGPVNIAQRS